MSKFLKEQKIDNRFLLGKKIGEGSFGEIYFCTDIQANEIFAMKIEDQKDCLGILQIEASII